MRKLTLFLLALLVSNILHSQVKIGGIYYNLYNSHDVEQNCAYVVAGDTKYTGYVSIPESVTYNNYNSDGTIQSSKTYPVTGVGDYAFSDCTELVEVIIPNSVTSIGDYVFSGCSHLLSVTIGTDVTSVGYKPFSGCTRLSSVTIKCENIGNGWFSGCTSLSQVWLGTRVKTIGNNAFSGCTSLTSFSIPEGITTIGQGAFSNCSGLTSIYIPTSVTSIGGGAFSHCSSLTSANIQSGSIEGRAFISCSSLVSLGLGLGVTNIGEAAFAYCSSLTSLIMQSSVTSIGNNAFNQCSSLSSVVIGDGVTSIGYGAFSDCTSLTSVTFNCPTIDRWFSNSISLKEITFGNNVKDISDYAFYQCSSLTSITFGNSVTSIGNNAFYQCASLTSVTLGGGVQSIGDNAFCNCDSLTSVTIPNSVTRIGDNAFGYCLNLKEIHITDMTGWCGISFGNGWAISTYFSGFNLYLNGEKVNHLVIPKEAAVVDKWAFYNCKDIETISVEEGNSVYDSRQGCNAIIETASNTLLKGCMSTIIPNDVNAIADYAFFNIEGLPSMKIPNSVTSIGREAFCYCNNLKTISIGNGVTNIDSNTFSYCSSLVSVTLPKNIESIGPGAFLSCKLRNVLIKSVTPPKLYWESFSDQTLYHTTLYVPTGSWDAYAYDNIWYRFINIRETAMVEEEVTEQQAYTLMDANAFTYSVYDPVNDCIGTIGSVAGINEDNPNHNWQVIKVGRERYLYNLGAKKFAKRGIQGLELSDLPTPIDMKDGENGIILGGKTSQQWALVANESLNNDKAIITSITPLLPNQNFNSLYFDLNGSKHSAPQKGINIINGRKVLMK